MQRQNPNSNYLLIELFKELNINELKGMIAAKI